MANQTYTSCFAVVTQRDAAPGDPTDAAATAACCSADTQASCCQPSEKASCCGTGSGCGCR
jgi:hypothetical protein